MSTFRMLKGCALLLGAGLLLSTGACGGDDDDGGGTGGGGGSGAGGGSIFSCDTPAKFACFEIAITPGPGLQAATDQCTADGGTPGSGCPSASVIGECKSPIHYYYYTGFSDITQAEQVCTSAMGGTWSTP